MYGHRGSLKQYSFNCLPYWQHTTATDPALWPYL